jgi:hypothetical protein
MADDIARAIVGIMDAREAQQAAELKAATLRTLRLSVRAHFSWMLEDEQGEELDYTAECVTYMDHRDRGWVLELNGARLDWQCVPFASAALDEQAKGRVCDWLVAIGAVDAYDIELYLELQMSLSLGTCSMPWMVHKDVAVFGDTRMGEDRRHWPEAIVRFSRKRAMGLLEVSTRLKASWENRSADV